MKNRKTYWMLTAMSLASVAVLAKDWPHWGGKPERNFYSPETGLIAEFEPGDFKSGTEEVDMSTTKNVRWVAKLGSSSYGNVTIANGRIFVGTNNETPRDPKIKGDYSMVYCFDEKSGKYLWQLAVPKLGAGKVSDWEWLGICSSPEVEGDRVYVVSSRCEILCLDFYGMENGNQGVQDEAAYMAGPGNPPIEVGAQDADIIWRYDMREELGVFPHNVTSSSVLITEDVIYASTSNGQDWSHKNIPSPFAPCLIALDKKTGKLIGEEASGIGERIMHCNWSSPTWAVVDDKPQLLFGAGDGFTYSYDPKPVKGEDDYMILKENWKVDCVPQKYRMKDGEPVKYMTVEGPSEIIATPVVYDNKTYIAIGQDPEHGEGYGNLVCIDLKTGKPVWNYDGIHRTISSVSVDPATKLLFICDYSGYVYCLDALKGEFYWRYDTKAHIWGSSLVADGKVYIGDEDGDFVILPATKDFDPKTDKPLYETMLPGPIYSSPVVANGVVYIATQTHLFALENK